VRITRPTIRLVRRLNSVVCQNFFGIPHLIRNASADVRPPLVRHFAELDRPFTQERFDHVTPSVARSPLSCEMLQSRLAPSPSCSARGGLGASAYKSEAPPISTPGQSWPFRFSLPDRSIIHQESDMKSPSIELSALVVSATITLALGEWLHWFPVITAIVVVHVLRRK